MEAKSPGAQRTMPEARGAAHSEGIAGADVAQPSASPAGRVEKAERPLITFALLAYNQERFIREAVEGAFSQTYSPLEIILSDDCSTDQTFEIMKEMAEAYSGPHTTILNRNAHNLGLGGHVNRVMEIAKGVLIVGAAGDDISLSERTAKIHAAWEASGGKAFSIHSQAHRIGENGDPIGFMESPHSSGWNDLEGIVRNHYWVLGATQAWHRRVFDVFGPMAEDVICEDMVIPFRAALIGEVFYVPEPLIKYRMNSLGHSAVPSPRESLASLLCFHRTLFGRLAAVSAQHLRDFQASARILPGVEKAIRETLETNRYRYGITEGSMVFKIQLAGRALHRCVPAHIVLKEALKFLFPRAYLVALRCRYRISR